MPHERAHATRTRQRSPAAEPPVTAPPRESTVRGSKAAPPRLPSVEHVLQQAAVRALCERHGRRFVTAEIRELFAQRRAAARAAGAALAGGDDDALVAALRARIDERLAPAYRAVLNLTGTVLHTNLGRAVVAEEAIAEAVRAMRSPLNLEFDLAQGGRGERDAPVEALLREITGAEAATIVNNNAAAVLLTIAALAARREVVVSRGEQVEIGGSFRMPDVMKGAGARMVEVGTTNRTHLRDYVDAIGAKTALVMKVHTSNYVVQGFAAGVDEAPLAAAAHAAGVPLAVDLGSGSLVDLAAHGLPREPLPQDSLAAGADVVTFSGDKLLGGPQAGIIVGRAALIERIRRHPLKRALRVSKVTLAALAATLALYRHPEKLAERLPTLRLLTRPARAIRAQAERVAPVLQARVAPAFVVEVVELASQIGSGSLPVDRLPSAGLAIAATAKRGAGRELLALAMRLRALPTPVIGRIAGDRLLLDLRCLDDEAALVAAIGALDLGHAR
jgi:L-seryl-tRNA(Ser) seleniumtransferase